MQKLIWWIQSIIYDWIHHNDWAEYQIEAARDYYQASTGCPTNLGSQKDKG